MEAIPIGIFWSIAAWTFFRQKEALMYLFFASMPFGSFAAIPTELTGGLTLTPTPIVALMLIGRELCSSRGMARALNLALKPTGLLLLFLFWLVAGIATIFMPRFFSNVIEIAPVRGDKLAPTAMLMPTVQNVSQLVYISVSVLTVFAFASILRSEPMRRRHAMTALCLGAAVTIATGAVDFASQFLRLDQVLEVFRTASYALLVEDEILGSKRVVGLMPEASSFGSLSLSFLASLYFFRRAMPVGLLRNRIVPILMVLLLVLVWLSTSSAAYLGLGLFGLAAAGEWLWRLLASGRNHYLRRGLTTEFWLGAMAIWGLLLIVLAVPRTLDPMVELFNVMVLQKSSSSSFEERSMWTQVSLNALWATHGLGVGLGGTRASNFAVALASNAGVLGAIFYFLFVLQCLLIRRAPPQDAQGRALMSAVRWAYLPPFFASLTIGTTPDFGVFNAFLYGFAVSISNRNLLVAGLSENARLAQGALRRASPRILAERSARAQ